MVRRLVEDSDVPRGVIRQDSAVSIVLAVQCVEVFFNVYFRVLVEEEGFRESRAFILDELNKQVGLERKLKVWPKSLFGKELILGSGEGQKFLAFKRQRDRLTHFSSTHEAFEIPGIRVEGLADTTIYDNLDAVHATNALKAARSVIAEIFLLRGIEKTDLQGHVHQWTGMPD